MKHEDIYHRWVQAKSQVDVSEGFAGRVMNQVKLRPSYANRFAWPWSCLFERISVSPWARVTAIGTASIVGLARILLTLHLLLSV
jgi:hypothetical protein